MASLPYEKITLDAGHELAWCVDDDGTEWPWIIASDCDGHGRDAIHGCACADCAPHERTGRLPATFRRRLVDRRCGAPTWVGTPCRNEVKRDGERCHVHREQAAVELLTRTLGATPIDEETDR